MKSQKIEINITKEFLRLHRVLRVEITPLEIYHPYFLVEFMDGRKITRDTIMLDHTQIEKCVKETILDFSIIAQRSKKINQIIKKIC